MSDIGALLAEMRGLLDGPLDKVEVMRLRNGFDRLEERLEIVERIAQEALVERHKQRLEQAQITIRAAYELLCAERDGEAGWAATRGAERLLELELRAEPSS